MLPKFPAMLSGVTARKSGAGERPAHSHSLPRRACARGEGTERLRWAGGFAPPRVPTNGRTCAGKGGEPDVGASEGTPTRARLPISVVHHRAPEDALLTRIRSLAGRAPES